MFNQTQQKAIAEYIESLQIPEEIKELIALANNDLYFGPVYLDDEGEQISYMDEGAKAFDFCAALTQINSFFDSIDSEVYLEDWSGCIVTDIPGDACEYDTYWKVDLKEEILGKELKSYI